MKTKDIIENERLEIKNKYITDYLYSLEADTLKFMVADLHFSVADLERENEELKQLEKGYAQSLGRLAQLCAVVCPWTLSNPPELTPVNVAVAAAEIMEYVNSVRP